MEIYHEWDKWARCLTVTVFARGHVYEPKFRLLPVCPHCHGRPYYGWPPEECGYCDDAGVVTPWRWLTYRIGSWFWEGRLGEWVCDFHWWRDRPADDYADELEYEYWKQ